MDDIIKILNIEDENVIVTDVQISFNIKYVTVEKTMTEHICPRCNSKMYSRGIRNRIVKHPILQDGYKLELKLVHRRWRCTNPDCLYFCTDSFNFVNRKKRTTNATDIMIVDAYRDLSKTSAEIGRQYNVSDHHAMNIFEKYVHMKRLPLTSIISVDEVYLDIDANNKYALVIQDFFSGEPIDLVKSRRKYITDPYFMKIPKEERYGVKYLISDMYNQYISYTNDIFPNATSVVDSFHVMQWIIHELDKYCNSLVKKFKERDEEIAYKKNPYNFNPDRVPISHEVYLLKKHRWVLLKNVSNIKYDTPRVADKHFGGMKFDAYDYEKRFFAIDPNLAIFRDLKEMYVRFNTSYSGDPDNAATELEDLIEFYSNCGYDIFQRFGNTLATYKQPIINSFVMTSKCGKMSRLSNGPIESLNRKVKDLKRNARGYLNFEHIRNRFLYSTRRNPHISFK